jgi:DNA primase
MSTWVNFKELREQIAFEDVLRFYGVEIKRKGVQHHGFCPLPNHNGKRNSQSFPVNLERGIFHCVGCGAKGNLLEFAALMEKVYLENGRAFREVALKLQERFCPARSERESSAPKPALQPVEPKSGTLVIVNGPLDFELKQLDANHQYLLSRGFLPETIRHFGLGFASRGMLKDRVAIPIHGTDGALLGYAGRVVDDAKANDDNPRYRFPGERKRGNALLEFRKTLFLYNGFRIKVPVNDLIVVEGFTSVWWLTQLGQAHVVATMGADCSEKQAELITAFVKTEGHVWIISDGDKAGVRHAESILRMVSPFRFVRWMKLPNGKQPTDLSMEDLPHFRRCGPSRWAAFCCRVEQNNSHP